MCGINGVINLGQLEPAKIKKILENMNDQVIHRGPDDEGYYYNVKDLYQVGMAMRRLSIIDLYITHDIARAGMVWQCLPLHDCSGVCLVDSLRLIHQTI